MKNKKNNHSSKEQTKPTELQPEASGESYMSAVARRHKDKTAPANIQEKILKELKNKFPCDFLDENGNLIGMINVKEIDEKTTVLDEAISLTKKEILKIIETARFLPPSTRENVLNWIEKQIEEGK